MGNCGKMCSKKNLRKSKVSGHSRKQGHEGLNKQVYRKLSKLSRLLEQQDSKCWQIGDLCIDLMDKHYLSLRQIAEFTNYSKARISHFHLTARTFPSGQRKGYTFEDSLTARQIWLRLPRLNKSPVGIRKIVSRLKNKRPRQVRAYFVQMLLEKEMNQCLAESAKAAFKGGSLINNCHNSDWREIVPKLPSQSVKLFLCDPPFGLYKKCNDGIYISSRSCTSGMRTDCDCDSTQDALAVTLPLFELCLTKLAPDGVLLLFQPGGKPDRPEILEKANQCGWECKNALTWSKGNITAGNHTDPYRVSSEKILIFCRRGDKLKKHQSGLSSSDILNYNTGTQSASIRMDYGMIGMGDYHIFQKPDELMEFLIKQHTYPGELVCDLFGCSGAAVIAAARLKRKWIYIELNKQNYLWGSRRIKRVVSELSVQAG